MQRKVLRKYSGIGVGAGFAMNHKLTAGAGELANSLFFIHTPTSPLLCTVTKDRFHICVRHNAPVYALYNYTYKISLLFLSFT